MMRAWILGLVLLGTTAGAQSQPPAAPPVRSTLKPIPSDTSLPRQKLVTVFGTDPCPKSADPDEIIICSRRPDEERFRIPPDVRADIPAVQRSDRTARLLGDDAGGAGGGIGSCSAVGPGGGTGCEQKVQDDYRAAKKKGEVPRLPQ